ncbi:MAG: TIGR00730 family Rossman fold protein [Pseudomonadota bacterium]|nr:TIGR00730 family Rossman fold protein [Pseudomonadota bacterium]
MDDRVAYMTTELKKVCVFCGSGDETDRDFVDMSRELGRGLAQSGLTILYGGGDWGMMGHVARAAQQTGGQVISLNLSIFENVDGRRLTVDEHIVLDTMFARKQEMFERSDAFIALPGGIGTIDEVTEAINLKKIYGHNKPIIILNPKGFWKPMLDQFLVMEQNGLMPRKTWELFEIVETVSEALVALKVPFGKSGNCCG